MRDTGNLQRDQRGMVAILVTMIMMLVITLIVIGFAQVTRRNQRAALDRQLSSQAYYAAESGVNDAVQYVKSNLADLDSTDVIPADASTNCTSFIDKLKNTTGDAKINTLSGDNSVSYTCLLVNPHPPTVTVKPLPVGKTTVLPLKSESGDPWSSFQFSWANNSSDAATKTADCPNPGTFPPADSPSGTKWNCSYGMLRVDLIDGSTISSAQDGNSDSVATFYMVPKTNGTGTVTYKTGASIVPAKCPDTTCTVTVNFPTPSSASYYVRLSMLYEQSDVVTINGKIADGSTGYFTGSVVVIDSTGKAQDQLRRMQVVLPLTGSGTVLPTDALQATGSLCKYFTIAPGDDIPAPGDICS